MTISPREQTRSLTGQQVGEYIVRDLVGVGGVGEVYDGTQPVIGKRVAIKVLSAERCDAESVARFAAEARAVNSIRHRNIVDIFAFGELPDGAGHYLVMEFLEGEAFDGVIAKRAPLDPAEALGFAEEVLEALSAAHAAGVVHRDIKPSNVFLVKPRRGKPYVKLLDFGAAKLGAAPLGLTTASPASQIIGTPMYMPPEQALGLPIGPSSDLYAVGVLLFELLTGRQLFPNVNPFESMRRHAMEPAPAPSSLVPTLPQELDTLLEALLRKDADQRPQSADQVRRWCEAIRLSIAAQAEPALAPTAPALPPVVMQPPPSMPAPAALPPKKSDPLAPVLKRAGRAQVALLTVTAGLMLTAGISGLRWKSAEPPPLIGPPPPFVSVRLHALPPEPPPSEPATPVDSEPELNALPPKPRPRPVAAAQVPPVSPALSDEALATRKAQLEARLTEREAAAGEPDRVVRRLLAGVDLAEARDEGSRRVAWNRLEEIGRQLDGR